MLIHFSDDVLVRLNEELVPRGIPLIYPDFFLFFNHLSLVTHPSLGLSHILLVIYFSADVSQNPFLLSVIKDSRLIHWRDLLNLGELQSQAFG